MTLTLKLRPEIEAGLQAQAQASGMSVEQYVLSMLEGAALLANKNLTSPEQRATAFEAWAAAHQHTPELSDYDVSRESMHERSDP